MSKSVALYLKLAEEFIKQEQSPQSEKSPKKHVVICQSRQKSKRSPTQSKQKIGNEQMQEQSEIQIEREFNRQRQALSIAEQTNLGQNLCQKIQVQNPQPQSNHSETSICTSDYSRRYRNNSCEKPSKLYGSQAQSKSEENFDSVSQKKKSVQRLQNIFESDRKIQEQNSSTITSESLPKAQFQLLEKIDIQGVIKSKIRNSFSINILENDKDWDQICFETQNPQKQSPNPQL